VGPSVYVSKGSRLGLSVVVVGTESRRDGEEGVHILGSGTVNEWVTEMVTVTGSVNGGGDIGRFKEKK
jgi:hypothetical protein